MEAKSLKKLAKLEKNRPEKINIPDGYEFLPTILVEFYLTDDWSY